MIIYRDATALDLPVLTSMEKQLFADAPWSIGQFKEEFKGVPRTHFFIVALNSDNEIIGYAAVMAPAPGVEADVLTVGVLPEHRKAGIGEAFMERLENWAIAKESNAMMLEVGVDNAAAIALYQSLGYSTVSTRKDYYGAGLDALVMRKEIS
ncbi:MAG: ribosomal protein S18-alanine N-acetyltransferase [Actinomycetota bacterium]|nr:ribosomal protein S18-alanine N-acetyltransferase [Actinomycetota bacterium]